MNYVEIKNRFDAAFVKWQRTSDRRSKNIINVRMHLLDHALTMYECGHVDYYSLEKMKGDLS